MNKLVDNKHIANLNNKLKLQKHCLENVTKIEMRKVS